MLVWYHTAFDSGFGNADSIYAGGADTSYSFALGTYPSGPVVRYGVRDPYHEPPSFNWLPVALLVAVAIAITGALFWGSRVEDTTRLNPHDE